MAEQDIGLKVKLDGVRAYTRDAKKVNAANATMARSINGTAAVSQKAAGGMAKFAKVIGVVAAAAVAYGGIRAIGGMISATAEFEQAIVNAASVTGKAGDEFNEAIGEMQETALELSSATKFTAREVANAFYDLASKGFDVAALSAKELMPILNFVAATQYDLVSGTELVTGTLRGFGLAFRESGRVADVFTKAIGSSAATAEKLRLSMQYVGPVAKGFNRDLEEVTATLAILYNRNIDASMAGTGLRQIWAKLADPTKEMVDLLDRYGIALEKVNPLTNNLADIMRTLDEAGLSAADMFALFEARAGTTALALTATDDQGTKVYDTIQDLEAILRDAGGTAERVAEQQLDTLSGQMTLLRSKIESLTIRIGRQFAPALKDIVKAMGNFLDTFDADPILNFARNVVIAFRAIGTTIGSMEQTVYRLGVIWDTFWGMAGARFEVFQEELRLGVRSWKGLFEVAFWGWELAHYKIWNKIIDITESGVNKIIDTINRYIGKIETVLNALGKVIGETFELPRIKPVELERLVKPPPPDFLSKPMDEDLQAALAKFNRFRITWSTIQRTWLSEGISGLTGWDDAWREAEEATAQFTSKAEDEFKQLDRAIFKAAVDIERDIDNAMAGAGNSIDALREKVQMLELALREAQAAMRGFADPRLVGMQEAEDELFEMEMAIKRARLEELGLGEAADEAAKTVADAVDRMAGGFDELAAQERELAEGIPVPFQRAMWEIEQAQKDREREGFKGIAADAGDEMSEVERLRRLREAKQLMYDLTYQPLLRRLTEQFEEMTGLNEELTFEQASEGMIAAHLQATILEDKLEDQKRLLEEQEVALKAQESAAGTYNSTREIALDIEAQMVAYLEEERQKIDEINALRRERGETMTAGERQRERQLYPGLQTGGEVTAGGLVKVGEKGTELAALPTGTRVMPATTTPATVNRSYQDTWNITEASRPYDVVDQIRRWEQFSRLTRGR